MAVVCRVSPRDTHGTTHSVPKACPLGQRIAPPMKEPHSPTTARHADGISSPPVFSRHSTPFDDIARSHKHVGSRGSDSCPTRSTPSAAPATTIFRCRGVARITIARSTPNSETIRSTACCHRFCVALGTGTASINYLLRASVTPLHKPVKGRSRGSPGDTGTTRQSKPESR